MTYRSNKEVWKTVEGFENYEVSTYGRVRHKQNGLLKPFYKERGDAIVTLYKNGERKTLRLARLVAKAFIKRDPIRNEVNHIDGNPRNNHVGNLEWATRQENIDHAHKLGLYDLGKRVTLYCTATKTSIDFPSMKSASRYLKKSENFVRHRIVAGNLVVDNRYLIIQK